MQKLATVILFIFFIANQIGLAQEQRKLQPAKSQNQPRLGIVADPGDENWYAISGINALIYALSVDGSGNVYAGCFFTTAGATNTNNIAKWDGNGWSKLGDGMNGHVFALAVDSSSDLFAGGSFTYYYLTFKTIIVRSSFGSLSC